MVEHVVGGHKIKTLVLKYQFGSVHAEQSETRIALQVATGFCQHPFRNIGQDNPGIRGKTMLVDAPLGCIPTTQSQQTLTAQVGKMLEDEVFPGLSAGCEALVNLDTGVEVIRCAILHLAQIILIRAVGI